MFAWGVWMSEGEHEGHQPVWSRTSRRRGGNPLIGLVVTLLALFGALTAVLAVKERSVAEGGAVIDAWLDAGWTNVRRMMGQADEELAEGAETAVAETGQAIQAAGEAVERSVD